MKKNLIVFVALIVAHFNFPGLCVYAQESSCVVKMPEISGDYSGGCKKGLAHGKGFAQGIDHYEGQFLDGFPNGNGKYTWSDGTYYEGQWKLGLKDGKGKLVSKDSSITGYWKNNLFVGTELLRPYQINRSLYIARTTIIKQKNTANEVRIKFLLGGVENTEIEDLVLSYNSGQEYSSGSWIGIQNLQFPVDIKITYRTWNQLHSVQVNSVLEFVINEPGFWEVVITN